MDALFADGPGRLAVDARTAVAIFKERMTIMNDRERFEEWAKNSGYALLKTGLNQYFYADTAAAWDAWQEALPHQPNLTAIAQKKLEQMGATVHGVLVKNEAGAWAAVSDAGRVMWLDDFEGQAVRAQGGEAVAYKVRDELFLHRSEAVDASVYHSEHKDVEPLYTHPSASVPEAIKHRARRVRNYSNPNEVFEAVPLSAFGPESTATPQHADEGCEWHGDDNGTWMSACGKEWYFEDGGPEDNGMNYCVKCGKPCIEIGSSEDGGEDYDNAM